MRVNWRSWDYDRYSLCPRNVGGIVKVDVEGGAGLFAAATWIGPRPDRGIDADFLRGWD